MKLKHLREIMKFTAANDAVQIPAPPAAAADTHTVSHVYNEQQHTTASIIRNDSASPSASPS